MTSVESVVDELYALDTDGNGGMEETVPEPAQSFVSTFIEWVFDLDNGLAMDALKWSVVATVATTVAKHVVFSDKLRHLYE